ncbi:hypothetical protein BJV78DRAFT_270820 [Lactifluus subvellereus]|nr:hypothetical protein BJV78DRAFT_270820 [Lactifluus subvellereus]
MGKVHGSLARAGKVKSQTPRSRSRRRRKTPEVGLRSGCFTIICKCHDSPRWQAENEPEPRKVDIQIITTITHTIPLCLRQKTVLPVCVSKGGSRGGCAAVSFPSHFLSSSVSLCLYAYSAMPIICVRH